MFNVLHAMLIRFSREDSGNDQILLDLDEWSRQLSNFYSEELSRGIPKSRYEDRRANGDPNVGPWDQQIWDKLQSYTSLLDSHLSVALSEKDPAVRTAKLQTILDELEFLAPGEARDLIVNRVVPEKNFRPFEKKKRMTEV